jgi:hypothetical protein
MDKEKLAELCHEQWSDWMEYLFSKCEEGPDAGTLIIPKWAVDRWKRQVATDYADLSKDEKDSDRREADKFLALISKKATKGTIAEEIRKIRNNLLIP